MGTGGHAPSPKKNHIHSFRNVPLFYFILFYFIYTLDFKKDHDVKLKRIKDFKFKTI